MRISSPFIGVWSLFNDTRKEIHFLYFLEFCPKTFYSHDLIGNILLKHLVKMIQKISRRNENIKHDREEE